MSKTVVMTVAFNHLRNNYLKVVAWHSGMVLVLINGVALCPARLACGWTTVFKAGKQPTR